MLQEQNPNFFPIGGSMTDSMIFNAMTTSMQLAQECLKESPSSGEEQAEASQPFEGLESFAQTIESGELFFTQPFFSCESLG